MSSLHLRLLVPISVFLLFCTIQLFEYTTLAPSQQRPPPSATDGVQKRYRLVGRHAGDTFFDGFNFEDASDPTHGHVKYLSRHDASEHNLTYTGGDGLVYIHTDHRERAPQGRKSVRISSKKAYTRGLFVLDVHHMPAACGAWPAFWTTAVDGWPNKGEIDVLEGVNMETDNAFTLHTSKGCRVARYRPQKGSTETTDCNVHAPNQWSNQGCAVKTTNSFGAKFNEGGGGVVVMEWTERVIRMWVFRRDDKVPFDLAVGAPLPDLDVAHWGVPDATFDSDECDIEGMFRDHVVIINTTLCGDWAGQVYAQSTCPGGDCVSYVSNHPEAFREAYWAISSLKIYQTS